MDIKEKQYRINIPYEVLYHLYVECKYSTLSIAKQLGCSQNTICTRLKEYEIPARSPYKILPKEEITSLFQSGHSVQHIASRYDVAKRTIYSRLHAWNLLAPSPHRRTPPLPIHHIIKKYCHGESASSLAKYLGTSTATIIHALQEKGIPIRYSKKRIDLPLHIIKDLYVHHKLSTPQIGRIYHVKPCTIAARLKEAGITLRGNHDELPFQEIIDKYAQGDSVQSLATFYHTSYHMIRNLLIRHGVYKKARRIRDCSYEIHELLGREQLSIAEIATHYACHPETIRRIIKEVAPEKEKTIS